MWHAFRDLQKVIAVKMLGKDDWLSTRDPETCKETENCKESLNVLWNDNVHSEKVSEW